jgi:hypothetical protein
MKLGVLPVMKHDNIDEAKKKLKWLGIAYPISLFATLQQMRQVTSHYSLGTSQSTGVGIKTK